MVMIAIAILWYVCMYVFWWSWLPWFVSGREGGDGWPRHEYHMYIYMTSAMRKNQFARSSIPYIYIYIYWWSWLPWFVSGREGGDGRPAWRVQISVQGFWRLPCETQVWKWHGQAGSMRVCVCVCVCVCTNQCARFSTPSLRNSSLKMAWSGR